MGDATEQTSRPHLSLANAVLLISDSKTQVANNNRKFHNPLDNFFLILYIHVIFVWLLVRWFGRLVNDNIFRFYHQQLLRNWFEVVTETWVCNFKTKTNVKVSTPLSLLKDEEVKLNYSLLPKSKKNLFEVFPFFCSVRGLTLNKRWTFGSGPQQARRSNTVALIINT